MTDDHAKESAQAVRLTRRQADVLFVVSQREPVSATDVAYSLLSTDTAERSRLDGLCRRGLLDRQYTGLRSGERVGYVLTAAGAAALDALNLDDDYDPTDDEPLRTSPEVRER